MPQTIQSYRVLFRDGVDLPYLVIPYKDIVGKPPMPSATFYGFESEFGSTLLKKEHKPVVVKNIHGINVYQNYIDRGWKDITKIEALMPWSIKSWLRNTISREV